MLEAYLSGPSCCRTIIRGLYMRVGNCSLGAFGTYQSGAAPELPRRDYLAAERQP